jgi:biotin carboxyl carrier protein
MAGCTSATAENDDVGRSSPTSPMAAPTTVPSRGPIVVNATTTTAIPGTGAPPAGEGSARTTGPPDRTVHEQLWTPFATVGGVVLLHPSSRVERVGFHQSNHEGAQQLEPLATAADPITVESRGRSTGSRTAADVVADPEVEIRAPITGRIRRAGTYVLYCEHSDDFAVIEPDDHPGWEVKVLHIDGVVVRRGDRVEAGRTLLAARPTPLPFDSQIDKLTAKPSWPHVHIEIVDPSIPDRPSGRGC